MKTTERVLAAFCFLFALPSAFLKLTWLPATVLELIGTYHEFSITEGTASFVEDRNARFMQLVVALVLYSVGSFAFFGFPILMATRDQRPLSLVIWLCALVIGVGLPLFDRVKLNAQMEGMFFSLAIFGPVVIAALSLGGIACWLHSARHRPPTKPVA